MDLAREVLALSLIIIAQFAVTWGLYRRLVRCRARLRALSPETPDDAPTGRPDLD